MSALRWAAGLLAGALACTAACAADAPPRNETLDYGLFGPLHLSRPAGAITRTVMLVSDRDGWTARQDELAAGLAAQGAFVVGIDLPAYRKRMESIADHCSFPAAHFEEVAHWIERHENLASYTVPLVVGDGSGATFAYAMAAQAPAGTFEGLITLGWDAALRVPKAFCPGDAGAMTVPTDSAFRVVPVAHVPLPWRPRPFAPGARLGGLGRVLAGVWQTFTSLRAHADLAPGDDLGRAYADWRRRADAQAAALPDDVADLPLTEIEPAAGAAEAAFAHRIAIIITGDGGWAGLDRGVADALTARGVRVIGFSTLKFFWQKQSPDAAAAALARVIAHYGKGDAQARFVLIGYSFGASLVPVVLNRLPQPLRERVESGVMISPDDEAVFEIHVGDWFGSTHHEGTLPLGPEIAASKVPLVCVHGIDEDDSFCLKPQPAQVRVVQLAGGHHYDGDYAALGNLIVKTLAAAAH